MYRTSELTDNKIEQKQLQAYHEFERSQTHTKIKIGRFSVEFNTNFEQI